MSIRKFKQKVMVITKFNSQSTGELLLVCLIRSASGILDTPPYSCSREELSKAFWSDSVSMSLSLLRRRVTSFIDPFLEQVFKNCRRFISEGFIKLDDPNNCLMSGLKLMRRDLKVSSMFTILIPKVSNCKWASFSYWLAELSSTHSLK